MHYFCVLNSVCALTLKQTCDTDLLIDSVFRLKLGPLVQVVLVFPRTDSVCEAWRSACLKRGLEVQLVQSQDEVGAGS